MGTNASRRTLDHAERPVLIHSSVLQMVIQMTDRPDPLRRHLLAGVPLASASMALGAKPAGAAETVGPADPPDPRQPRFETTDHVATFYRLSRR